MADGDVLAFESRLPQISSDFDVSIPPWKGWDQKANKNGDRHTVYFRTYSEEDAIKGQPWADHHTQHFRNQYVGQWQDNLKDGYGIQIERNGNKYEGEWRKGRRHGRGTFYVCLKGKLFKRYEGQWVDDRMEGRGKYYYADGRVYDGEWHNNQRNGQGRFVYLNGDLYEGQWVNGNRHGFGILDYANGDRFEGEWMLDVREGPGTYYYASTNRRLDGEWVSNVARAAVLSETDPNGILPRLEVCEPMMVISNTLARIRHQRDARIPPSHDGPNADSVSLSPAEVKRVARVFDEVQEPGGTASLHHVKAILLDLGMPATTHDVLQLAAQRGLSPRHPLTLTDVQQLVHRAKQHFAPQQQDQRPRTSSTS